MSCGLDSLAGEAVAALKLLCADKPAYTHALKQEAVGANTTLPPVMVKINGSLVLPRLHEPAPAHNNCAGNHTCNGNINKQHVMHSGHQVTHAHAHTASLIVNASHLGNNVICTDKGVVVSGLDALYNSSATVGYHALMAHSLRKFSDMSPPNATHTNALLIASDHSTAVVKPMVDFTSIPSGITHGMSMSTSVDRLVDRCAVYTHAEAANVHAHLGALLQAGATADGTQDITALLCRGS